MSTDLSELTAAATATDRGPGCAPSVRWAGCSSTSSAPRSTAPARPGGRGRRSRRCSASAASRPQEARTSVVGRSPMFERFTRDARGVVRAALAQAQGAGAPRVLPDTCWPAWSRTAGLASLLLEQLGAPREDVLREVHRLSRCRDGLDADDAEALRLLGIDLDDVIARVDRDLGGWPARGRRRPSSPARRRRRSSFRCARHSGSVTPSSAPSTCCWACFARATRSWWRPWRRSTSLSVDIRRAVEEADRQAG